MTRTYSMAYTEVLEIISHFSNEEYSKIPKEKIEFYKTNMDKNYNYTINPELDLSKQDISTKANAIIISLFRDYFANESQKKTLQNLLEQNYSKIEEEKNKIYKSDNLFKNNSNINVPKNNINLLIEVKKETFLQKIKNYIKKFFNKSI